jgi:hypothetical protein
MGTNPASIVNRALDIIGRPDLAIGELGEGTEAAKPALRAYGPAMRQMLRAAHWGFARKQFPLVLLDDATGQTPGVGTQVQAPWTYKYAWPTDCIKVRFLPWNTNPIQPTPPIMTNVTSPPLNAVRLVPAPFLLGIDYNNPVQEGCYVQWPDLPDWADTPGEGPLQRTAIYTNVPPQPQSSTINGVTTTSQIMPCLVYTALVVYPSQWDSLFEEALVQYLAQKLAMPLTPDKKLGRVIRDDCIASGKGMITEARAINANESGFPQTISRMAEWSRVRNAASGYWWGNGGVNFGAGPNYSGPGMLSCGWDALGWADGSVF